MILIGEVEVITSKDLRSPSWPVLLLWNICASNDHDMFHLWQTLSDPFFIADLSEGL